MKGVTTKKKLGISAVEGDENKKPAPKSTSYASYKKKLSNVSQMVQNKEKEDLT